MNHHKMEWGKSKIINLGANIIHVCISVYVSGSSKIQTLLPSNIIEISPQGFKFCNSVEKYQMATMFGFYLNHSHIQQARPGLLLSSKACS